MLAGLIDAEHICFRFERVLYMPILFYQGCRMFRFKEQNRFPLD